MRKEEKNMKATVIERYCTPAESLEESLKEMMEMRKTNAPKRNWRDMMKDLEDDLDQD